MPRFFAELMFNGENYHGWQIQPNGITVQSVLNEKLTVLLKENITTTGAGRTDTGVHANYFVAHFDCSSNSDISTNWFLYKINRFLPHDIKIIRLVEVNRSSHARYDALSRTYKYYVSTEKNVFQKNQVWQVFQELDVDLMNQGANIIREYSDFTSFSKLHTDVANNNCEVSYANWAWENKLLVFEITANRFLRNMVRAIVGTLISLGHRKFEIEDIRKIIEGKDRTLAGESAPARGLFLFKIAYPYTF